MSLDENISHCFREYPKMKRRIEILETENQRLQAEVARLTKLEASLRASHQYLTRRGKALEGAYNCAQRTLRQLSGDASARERTRCIAQDGLDEAENLRIQLEAKP